MSFNLIFTTPDGNKCSHENLSGKTLFNYIRFFGHNMIDPDVIICPNQKYLGKAK